MTLYHGALALPSSDNRPLNKCQVAIGRASVRFLVAKSKALRDCWLRHLATPDACPDGYTSAKIAGAHAVARAKICHACGGGDHLCSGGDGFSPATIGFVTSCPAVTGTTAGDCGAIDPIDDLDDLAQCATCVTDFKGDCADAVPVPGLTDYPPDCVTGPEPTQTPTPTPTPEPTPTGPTPTPTAVACCSLPPFCGNIPPGHPGDCTNLGGTVIPGYYCQPNNDAGCPVPGACGDCVAP
jgi:hypothetical protein